MWSFWEKGISWIPFNKQQNVCHLILIKISEWIVLTCFTLHSYKNHFSLDSIMLCVITKNIWEIVLLKKLTGSFAALPAVFFTLVNDFWKINFEYFLCFKKCKKYKARKNFSHKRKVCAFYARQLQILTLYFQCVLFL